MDEPCKRFGGSFQCGILRNRVRTGGTFSFFKWISFWRYKFGQTFSTRGVGFAAVAVQRHSFALATRSRSTNFPSSGMWNLSRNLSDTSDQKIESYYMCYIIFQSLSRIQRHTRENIHPFCRETRLRKQFQHSRYNVKIINSVCKNC